MFLIPCYHHVGESGSAGGCWAGGGTRHMLNRSGSSGGVKRGWGVTNVRIVVRCHSQSDCAPHDLWTLETISNIEAQSWIPAQPTQHPYL